jgi:hypothetical protein
VLVLTLLSMQNMMMAEITFFSGPCNDFTVTNNGSVSCSDYAKCSELPDPLVISVSTRSWVTACQNQYQLEAVDQMEPGPPPLQIRANSYVKNISGTIMTSHVNWEFCDQTGYDSGTQTLSPC